MDEKEIDEMIDEIVAQVASENKKEIAKMIDETVVQVANENSLSETEARCFVGVALRNNREAFIRTICIPKLGIIEPPKPE